MVFPYVTGLSLSLLLGAALIIGSIVHFGQAVGVRGWNAVIWQAALAGIYLVGGLALLTNPFLGLATLTTLLIGFFLLEGIIEIGMGLQSRSHTGWGSLVGSGLLSLVLAGILIVDLPGSLVWAVGLLFGVNLLVTGLTMAYVGLTNRRQIATTEPVDEGAMQKPSV
jgi:uncharacterized membrane protein HdeD (DUF308 family)